MHETQETREIISLLQAREAADHQPRRQNMGFYTRFLKSSADDLKDPQFYRALIGELIGVLFLVFVACSSPYGDKDLDNTRVSLCFGLSVATMVWLLANVSGGHINPAVTSGMFITRKVCTSTSTCTSGNYSHNVRSFRLLIHLY